MLISHWSWLFTAHLVVWIVLNNTPGTPVPSNTSTKMSFILKNLSSKNFADVCLTKQGVLGFLTELGSSVSAGDSSIILTAFT